MCSLVHLLDYLCILPAFRGFLPQRFSWECHAGLVRYTAASLRAQRLLCFALSVAPYATLPPLDVTQARVIGAISKLFIADFPDTSVEAPDAALHRLYAPLNTTPAACSISPEIQAPFSRPGWQTPLPARYLLAGGNAACSGQASVAECSRIVRGALRHSFATLVATVLTSMVDGCAEHTTVDVAAAGCSSDARCSAAGYVPRFAEEHLTHGETRADCVPISITLAVTQAIQVAIKHLCSHESAGSVAAWHERGAPGSTCHADAPRKSHTDATALPAAGGLQGDAAAGHGSTIHGAFPAAVCPTVHTPAMLGEAGGSGPAPGSTDHKSMVVGGEWPSGTPPVDNTPNMQHELASAECIFRSFPSVRPALIDCIERAFDAANNRWAEEEPGVFAGTPMYRGGHTPLQNHGAAVPHEVESVLALCGTLGEECDALLPQDVLAARTSQWLTSMRVDPPLGWQLPRDDAGASPLLYSPLSPFGGYGASTSSGVVVTMMHAVPMAALVASLDAAMKLPMHALSGVKAAQHIRSMMRLRAQLQAACCSTLRGAHKAINASDEGPSSTQVVQAVAAASTAMSCAMVAIDASGKCSASLANQQASLGGMQAVPQALHTLYDVAWRSPLPNTQSSVQRVMMQLIQNTSHCEMHNSLASAALDLAAGSPQTPTVPHLSLIHI